MLDGNNSYGGKTRMKITTNCSGAVEGYGSCAIGCCMRVEKETWSPVGVGYLSVVNGGFYKNTCTDANFKYEIVLRRSN